MYIEAVPNRNSPPAILLRESYRDGSKVRKRTLLNLTDWPADLVAGFRALLKGGTILPAGQEALILPERCRTAMSPPCSAHCAKLALIACSVPTATAAAISSRP